jgi:hypothetical protein
MEIKMLRGNKFVLVCYHLHEEWADSKAGLPDGIFSNQKSRFGLIFEGLEMENVETFGTHYGHLVYFMALC